MKKIVRYCIITVMLMAFCSAQGARVAIEYGLDASLTVIPQKGLQEGVPGKISVMFVQDVSANGFREATDYAATPVFQAVEGIRFDGQPRLKTSKDEITNKLGKHTLTKYYRIFVYPVTPERSGEFTIDGVTFDFHGKTLKADPVTFSVEAAPAPAPVAPDLRRYWLKAPVRKIMDGGLGIEFNTDGTEDLSHAQAVHRDAQGRLEKAEFGMVDYEYTYDENGLMTVIQVFDKQGRIREQYIYTYYDILEPATETYSEWFEGDKEPSVHFVTRYYQYKWDEHGNWIRRIAEVQDYDSLDDLTRTRYLDNSPVTSEERTLIY